MTDHHDDEHDLGLQHDLPRITRRLGLFGLVGAGAVALAACSDDSTSATTGDGTPSSGAPAGAGSATAVADGEIPEETAGPYPGDGSNGPNVLTESGIVRSDLTTSFGSSSGVAGGVPTTVRLRIMDMDGDDVAPYAGAALYLWHCTREGGYSLYSDGLTDQNFLRGVQEADDDGWMEFTTIWPACYDGRWPHMHFEVYESLDKATSAGSKLRTSQLALPQDVCEVVYQEEGYEASVDNLAAVSLDTDLVFSDGYSLQTPKVSGSVDEGYTLTLNVPV